MFFSANQLYKAYKEDRIYLGDRFTEGPVTKASVCKYVAACKAAILRRDTSDYDEEFSSDFAISKWFRPWEIVPKLREFSAPEGDYGIGVEVEVGCDRLEVAQQLVGEVKNWRNIAVDEEGAGPYGTEFTFPPFLYSKMSNKSQPFRFMKVLSKYEDTEYEEDTYGLSSGVYITSNCGVHVNVSKGGVSNDVSAHRLYELRRIIYSLYNPQHIKYFNRYPYGVAYNSRTHVEFKLFRATFDPKALRRYVNIAVALTDLLLSEEDVNIDTVLNALELGYNK